MINLHKSAEAHNNDPYFGRPFLIDAALGHLRAAESNVSEVSVTPNPAGSNMAVLQPAPAQVTEQIQQQVTQLEDARNKRTIEDLRSEVDSLYGGNPLYDQQAA